MAGLKKCTVSIVASMILAFGLYNIHAQADITEGGVLGATLLLKHLFNVSPAFSGAVLSGICYIIGYKYLGKQFILYSAISAGGFSVFYYIFEQFPPIYPQIYQNPFVSAILGAVFVGVGAGFCVKMGGAPSGDDAIAMAFSKKFKINIEIIYLITDVFVLGASLCYIPIQKLWYSILTVFISGQIIGFICRIKFLSFDKNNL